MKHLKNFIERKLESMRLENDLKPHNKETYGKLKDILQTNNKTCIIQPTGSGKSYLILKLIEDYVAFGRDIIIIEPQKYIFDQLQKKIDKYGLPKDNVKFLTYSALGKLNDEKIQEYNSPMLIVIDEMHRAGAKTWEKGLLKMFDVFPDDCKYVGFSATPIRFLDGKRNMAEELFNGCIANEIGLADAILNRILPLPRYIAGLYTYDNEVNAITRKIENSRNTEEEKKQLLEEVAIMKKNLDKGKGVSAIFKKYIDGDKGKYVAFCRNINHLKLMRSCLEQWFSEAGISCNFYEVHCKNPQKDKQFNAFMADDKLSVCLSVAMLSEGVHGIDGVILLRDTISPNLYYQQIGRVFAVDMDTVPIIFDLVANCNSIMDCNLKNDLLNAIDKRDNGNDETCADDSQGSDGVGNFDVNDSTDITKDDIESFFVFDQVIDAVNAFKEIEGRIKTDDWTEEDENLLQQYYPNMGTKIKSMLSVDRSNRAIKSKAWTMGLKCEKSKKWQDKDMIFLDENYGVLSIGEIAERLDRTKESIIAMACKLGIKDLYHSWSDEENKIFKKYYYLEGVKVAERLPYKTEKQCKTKANGLHLTYIGNKKKSKYKYVTWSKKDKRWIVRFKINGKSKYFGYFTDEDEAGKVALEKAKEYGKAI